MKRTSDMLAYIAISFRLQLAVMRKHKIDVIGAVSSIGVSSLTTYLILERTLPVAPTETATPFLTFMLAGGLRISYGLVEAMTESFWDAGGLARSGGLTQLLVQPVPVALQFMMRQINYERILHSAVGVYFIVLAYSYPSLPVNYVFISGFICFIFATPAFFAIILTGAAISIQSLSNAGTFMTAMDQIATAGLLPVSVLRAVLSGTMLAIFPLSVATLLAERIAVGETAPWGLVVGGLTSWAALIGIAAFLWRSALHNYQGTGS